MSNFSNTKRKNLVNKSFSVIQKCVGLGLPAEFFSLQFNTFPNQHLKKRSGKGPKKAFISKYDKDLLMKLDLIPPGAMGTITVGKITMEPEELDKIVQMLITR